MWLFPASMYNRPMLADIDVRFEAWAYWSLSKSAGGFPKMCSFTRLTPRSSTYHGFGNIDQDAWEVDTAVQAVDENLKNALVAYYLGTGTMAQKARDCGCSLNTFKSRIERGREAVGTWIIQNRRSRKLQQHPPGPGQG